MMDEKIYTTKQVAEKLRIAPHCVYHYIKTGNLLAKKKSGRLFVGEKALQVFIKNRHLRGKGGRETPPAEGYYTPKEAMAILGMGRQQLSALSKRLNMRVGRGQYDQKKVDAYIKAKTEKRISIEEQEEDSNFFNTAQTAHALDVSVEHVRHLISVGKLKATKVGGQYFVHKKTLEGQSLQKELDIYKKKVKQRNQVASSSNFVTTDQAARILGVSLNRVRKLIQTGEVKGKKVGGKYFINKADVKPKLRTEFW